MSTVLKVHVATGLDPVTDATAQLLAPILRAGFRLALYREGEIPFPEGTARPFCLVHGEASGIIFTRIRAPEVPHAKG